MSILALVGMTTGLWVSSLSTAHARDDVSAIPDWVPKQYRGFFYRAVDARPGWQRALQSLQGLGMSLDGEQPAFALVAGISKYPKMTGRAGDLWPARIDVKKLVAHLSREPESFNEIVVLMDDAVTEENLRYFLTRYFPRRFAKRSGSRFLFAYSGHGTTTKKGHGYLLTSEATDLDAQDNIDARISFSSLRAYFDEVVKNGHQVLALINACYGSEFAQNVLSFDPTAPPPAPTREGAHAITGGGSGEKTWSDQLFGLGHGEKGSVFFETILLALDGRADKLPEDGIIDVRELETYVHSTISTYLKGKQNPASADLSPPSPGGFFFLDNYSQVQKKNGTDLRSDSWTTISFDDQLPKDRLYQDEDFIMFWDRGAYEN